MQIGIKRIGQVCTLRSANKTFSFLYSDQAETQPVVSVSLLVRIFREISAKSL